MRTALEKQLAHAKATLAQFGPRATESNRAMLETAIRQAETVLRGETLLPTSHSRAYVKMAEEDWQRFALSHYVMYAFDHDVLPERFGLEKAVEWFIRSVERKAEDGFLLEGETSAASVHFAFEEGGTDYLLFSEGEWAAVRERLDRDETLRAQYELIREIAERIPDDELDTQWRATWKNGAQLPEHVERFSDTSMGFIIQAPAGAVAARVEFVFPQDALTRQSWRIKDLRLNGANTGDQPYPGELHLLPGANILVADASFAVQAGNLYTLLFSINQREKLAEDIQVIVRYRTVSGEDAGSQSFAYNRKAWYPAGGYCLHMQCCAICYGVTGDERHARRAIRLMLLFLDEFVQGALHWMVHNARPEGRDSYGAVQAGRILCSTAMTYVMVRSCMTQDERARFVPLCEFILHDCFDLRDRTILTLERAQRGTSNWQTDMCIGAAMIAAAVEDLPHRRLWLLNAEAVLRAQIALKLNADGSWPESLRYHHAALGRFCTFARFWEHETGENWFARNGLDRMFAYSAAVQTPPYRCFDSHISTPPFGDHKLGGGEEYSILGEWVSKVGETNAALAAQMQDTWQRAGCPVKHPGGENVVAELLLIDNTRPAPIDPSYRMHSRAFPDAGLYIFRREETGTYLAVMAPEKPIGHGHLDMGSFIWYCGGTPLVMDTGIRGYFDASTQWHISPLSHACMLFAAQAGDGADKQEINLSAGNYTKKRGWLDTPRNCRVLDFAMDGDAPYIRLEIAHLESKGTHIRQITLNADSSVTIADETDVVGESILFSLPMVAQAANITQERNVTRVLAAGFDGVDLCVDIHSPVQEIRIDEGRATPVHAGDDPGSMLFLRAVARAEDGFCVTLRGIAASAQGEHP